MCKVDAKELDVIYHQFQTMDIDQDGYIKEQEFYDCIGIMCDLPFAQALFSLVDEERDNKIDFIEFLTAMTILFKGSPHEQLACTYSYFCEILTL
jgi:Ca2+-binding EF-hand superfamily protein